ncbi:beta-xylosidase family glycoside hydrolase [Cohnella fermenti]|uniref:DUF1349 domain-containing protein n=1 Tax=Cohnella fermenti TaxID=2565925 RepID=A0A4S4C1Z9_9BACL|nr:DUF1349 domain-containing protein [Cohnella fermenti]THF81626.1 DUF1349 domain-containing protein [Cohnella fermenti]
MATTYYVSSSGNDSNAGTSASAPWQTLTKASALTYQPGDQLLIKRGDVWNESLSLKGTGTSASPIVVGAYGAGDAPKLYGNWPASGPTKINDDNSGITYTGSWGYNSSAPGYYNNDFHHSNTAGNEVQFTFTGTSVAWIGPKGSNEGKADVYMDNVLQKTVDLYNASSLLQQWLYSVQGLPDGTHTIKIVVRSDKNPSSTDTNVLVDCFQYASLDVGILIDTPSGWEVRDLELANFPTALNANAGTRTNLQYVRLENLFIHDCYLADHSLTAGDILPRAVSIGAGDTGASVALSDIYIKNCVFENCTVGIDMGGGVDGAYNIKDVTISGITALEMGSSPLSLFRLENATVTELISVCGANDYFYVGSCSGFAQHCKDVTFVRCEFADGRRNDCYDGAGFDYEGSNDGVVFDQCLFHDNANSAIMIMNNPSYNVDIEIKNSVFYNDCLNPDPRSIYAPVGEIALLDINNTGIVHDNTIYDNVNVGSQGGHKKYDNSGLSFYNNVEMQEPLEVNGANLAAAASATASTNSGSAGNVKDGNLGTAWTAATSADQWVQLEFASSVTISKFYVKEASGSSIDRFQVQYWDHVIGEWRSCFNGKRVQAKRVMPIIPVSTSKIRFYIFNTISGNPSLSEWEVYQALPPAHTDEFDSATLNPNWSWIREDAANWSLTSKPGRMSITLQSQDIWGPVNTTENILLRDTPMLPEWQASTKLNFQPVANYQNAGLIAYGDDDNYILLGYGYDSGAGGLCVSVARETGGTPSNSKIAFQSNPVYLRIKKSGTTCTLDYSHDEITWTTGATYTGIAFAINKIGLIAQGTAGVSAEFEWFDFPLLTRDRFDVDTTGIGPAGWTTVASGGTVTVQNVPSATDKSVRLQDTNGSAIVGMSKTYTLQNGWLRAAASIRPEQTNHGLEFELRSAGTWIGCIRFHSDGNIKYIDGTGEHTVQAYSSGAFYKLAFIANINLNKFDVYVDDVLKASGCVFANGGASSLDSLNIESWDSTTGTHYVNEVEWTNVLVMIDDDWNREPQGFLPGGWAVDATGGTITVENVPSAEDKSVRLQDSSGAAKSGMSRTFVAHSGWVNAAAYVRSDQASGHGLDFELKNASVRVGCIRFHSDGNIKYVDSSGEHTIQSYSSGVFYKFGFVANPGTNKFDVYVNDVLKASGCGFENSASYLDRINIESWGSTSGTHYVNAVSVLAY